MKLDDVETLVEYELARLPESVQAALQEVEVVVLEAGDSVDGVPFPSDQKGLYQGTQLAADDGDDDGEADPPTGTVYLYAPNLADEEDVTKTLWHELGHALGMSEEDVAALGLSEDEPGETWETQGQDEEDDDDDVPE
jgi:predicted Zn-dependent protease with MMP-like domain